MRANREVWVVGLFPSGIVNSGVVHAIELPPLQRHGEATQLMDNAAPTSRSLESRQIRGPQVLNTRRQFARYVCRPNVCVLTVPLPGDLSALESVPLIADTYLTQMCGHGSSRAAMNQGHAAICAKLKLQRPSYFARLNTLITEFCESRYRSFMPEFRS